MENQSSRRRKEQWAKIGMSGTTTQNVNGEMGLLFDDGGK